MSKQRIAIIGANISGCLATIKLLQESNQVHIDLYEQKSSIMSGSPYAHLHSGGFLYPTLNISQCKQLLNDSLFFASYFKYFLQYRPTIIAYNSTSSFSVIELLQKCIILQQTYANHSILGHPLHFFATYSKDDIIYYKNNGHLPHTDDTLYPERSYHDPFVETFCSLLQDIDSIKYPFVSVLELGIDNIALTNYLVNIIQHYSNSGRLNLYLNSPITHTNAYYEIKENVWYVNNILYDIVINCSGPSSHSIFPNYIKKELLELKTAWLIQPQNEHSINPIEHFPEIAIIGERSTPHATLQIIPHSNSQFQIHYMSSNSSIIHSSCDITHPFFKDTLLNDSLNPNCINIRSNYAIKFLSSFFPYFHDFVVKDCVWGIQRIPDNCIENRLSNIVSNCNNTFFDIQTVKATSIVNSIFYLIEYIFKFS